MLTEKIKDSNAMLDIKEEAAEDNSPSGIDYEPFGLEVAKALFAMKRENAAFCKIHIFKIIEEFKQKNSN